MSDHVQREELELVQVAAVAAASLENMIHGTTDFDAWVVAEGMLEDFQGMTILDLIAAERRRQDEKWGSQSHGRISWAMILAEEIGEWAEELDVNDEEMESHEMGIAAGVIKHLSLAGAAARDWLESHEWPERQQQVYDSEGGSDGGDA